MPVVISSKVEDPAAPANQNEWLEVLQFRPIEAPHWTSTKAPDLCAGGVTLGEGAMADAGAVIPSRRSRSRHGRRRSREVHKGRRRIPLPDGFRRQPRWM